jgi:type I restriction enzyme, S subunit
MSANWSEVKLGDVCNVVPGFAFKSKDWSEHGIPVLKIKNITSNNTVDLSDVDHVPSALLTPKLEKFVLMDGDIVVAMTGATAGKVGKLRTDRKVLLNQRVAKIEAIEADKDFIWAVVSSEEYQRRFFRLADGAAQPNMSGSQIEGVLIRLPSLAEQRRIGQIIASYDNLIDINRRRIALLEEMAQRLYEEWFVSFRFPGHEGHAMIETLDGVVPAGWQTRKLGDVCAYLSRGIAPKYDEDAAGIVVGQKCIRDQRLSLAPARRQSKPVPNDKLVRSGDVLINSTGVGTLGRAAQAEDVPDGLTVDSHVTIVRAGSEVDRDFFGLSLLRQEALFERLGAGATGQTELNRARLAELAFLHPPQPIQNTFGRHARPLRGLACKLARHNEVLATSRDLLLPRMISGELSVLGAEQELEAAE